MILYLNLTLIYMPWRGIEPPRFLARDFESRVSTISPPRLDHKFYISKLINTTKSIPNKNLNYEYS